MEQQYQIVSAKGETAPLKYKNIGEVHLTFESIRMLAFQQISESGERKARQHIVHCLRCQSIYESFTSPTEVRKSHSHTGARRQLLVGILLVMMATSAPIIYFGSSSFFDLIEMSDFEDLSSLLPRRFITNDKGPELTTDYATAIEPSIDSKSSEEAHALKPSDTRTSTIMNSKLESNSTSGSQIGSNPGTQQVVKNNGKKKLRGIYGKITANGKPLQGVTIRVLGSRIAKVSNSKGKYYIQVPSNVDSLKFIYQGKQLVKELDTTSREQELYLNIEQPLAQN